VTNNGARQRRKKVLTLARFSFFWRWQTLKQLTTKQKMKHWLYVAGFIVLGVAVGSAVKGYMNRPTA
jgi:hypothetical protein